MENEKECSPSSAIHLNIYSIISLCTSSALQYTRWASLRVHEPCINTAYIHVISLSLSLFSFLTSPLPAFPWHNLPGPLVGWVVAAFCPPLLGFPPRCSLMF